MFGTRLTVAAFPSSGNPVSKDARRRLMMFGRQRYSRITPDAARDVDHAIAPRSRIPPAPSGACFART